MKNNSPIDLKNQLLSVISQMQSVSHLFVETGKDFSRKRKNFFLRYHSVSLIYGREYHSERMVRFLGFFSGYGFGSRLLPATSEIVAWDNGFLISFFQWFFFIAGNLSWFRLLACDKSDLAIAYTPDDKDTYRRHNSLERHEKGYNQLHFKCSVWGIERSFRELKYTIGLTNFHAKKVEYILQEIFARLTIYNFCERIITTIAIQQKNRKYTYQTNFTVAVFICREYFRDRIHPSDLVALIREEYSSNQRRTKGSTKSPS